MFPKLKDMGSQRALFMLRSSMGASRLTYVLRAGQFPHVCPDLVRFDDFFLDRMATQMNISLTPRARDQASLPIALGGLGLCSSNTLLLPCQLASRHASEELVEALLPAPHFAFFKSSRARLETLYVARGLSLPENKVAQASWSKPLFMSGLNSLIENSNCNVDRARLMAVSSSFAGDWLFAVPSTATGTWMDDETFRICLGLRLGAPIVAEHTCCCGHDVSLTGTHGLSCRRSAGRFARHALLNDAISRALRRANIPNSMEPVGLSRSDGRRPDGLTLVPFDRGMPLVWDVTVTDSLAASYVAHSAFERGYAANLAETNKFAKYACLRSDYFFSPIALETLGGMGKRTSVLVKGICSRLHQATGSRLAGVHFRQLMSLSVQRGNAASVLGTMASYVSPVLGPEEALLM